MSDNDIYQFLRAKNKDFVIPLPDVPEPYKSKLEGLVSTYLPKNLGCIAGGAVHNIMTGRGELKDVDIFPFNKIMFLNFCREELGSIEGDVTIRGTTNNDSIGSENIYPAFISGYMFSLPNTRTPQGFTLNGVEREDIRTVNYKINGTPVQIVLSIRDNPKHVISTFDLSVCQWAVTRDYLYFGKQTLNDCDSGILHVENSNNPVYTFNRIKLRYNYYYLPVTEVVKLGNLITDFSKLAEEKKIPITQLVYNL